MPEKSGSEGFESPKEQVKSPEELRFEQLTEDARHRGLEGDYTFALTAEDEQEIHKETMLGAYWESGDPEKMAMFKLQEASANLSLLALSLDTLAHWNERRQEEGYIERAKVFIKGWKKGWEEARDKMIAELQPVLSELGLAIPQTAEDARVLKNNIVSFENLQKLAEKYKAEQNT